MEKEKEDWYYIVRKDYINDVGKNPNYYKHKDKAEALRRATRYMSLSIENLCSDYRMGKFPDGVVHKIIFRLCYTESLDGGMTYNEVILEEKRLADYVGNHPIH